MADVASASERPDAALIAALEAANIHPLWDRYKRITPLHPNADDQPFHWRWSEIEPFTLRALKEVAIEDIERRALIMYNAAFGGQTVTTSNLIAAFSVLQPGDRAVPHRHVAAAIRFATNAEGASTIVNGRRCEMHAGDLILTPPMCWHGHINESDGPISWFDAANIPLINTLDVNFFEPGERGDNSFWQVDEGDNVCGRHRGWSHRTLNTTARSRPNTAIPVLRPGNCSTPCRWVRMARDGCATSTR